MFQAHAIFSQKQLYEMCGHNPLLTQHVAADKIFMKNGDDDHHQRDGWAPAAEK